MDTQAEGLPEQAGEEEVNSQQAFDVLLSELQQALTETKTRIAQAAAEGHFAQVQAAAQQAEQIQKQLALLQALRKNWPGSGKIKLPMEMPKKEKKKAVRLQKGKIFSDKQFRLPLLQALVELGGSAPTKQAIDKVGELIKDQLKTVDFNVLADGRTLRWRNTAAWARQQLVEEGLMKKDSPNGTWEISDLGRRHLQENTPA